MQGSDSPHIVITGANSGVGFSATRLLAAEGARVVMVCRDRERASAAAEQIRGQVPGAELSIELADLSSMREAHALGDRLHARGPIDVLVNNAGVARMKHEITADGFEATMATNHLGHFALTRGVIDRLVESRGRIINVSSEGHRRADLRRAPLGDILHGRIKHNGFQAYCDSKLANVLFTSELHRRYADKGLTAVALHPGVLSTRIWNSDSSFGLWIARLLKPFMDKPDVGGRAVHRLATDPELAGSSGAYFKIQELVPAAEQANDESLAAELWKLSAQATDL